MATTHHFHVRSDPVSVSRRRVAVIGSGFAAAACAVVAFTSISSSGDTVVDLGVEPAGVDALNRIEPVSTRSPSILLDGAAFELAVNDAVAFATNGSALLDATAFDDAVAAAVTAATK